MTIQIKDLSLSKDINAGEMSAVRGGVTALEYGLIAALIAVVIIASPPASGSGSGPVSPTLQLSCANGRHFSNATLY